ncbi:GntR family transcriptional regulator [Actinoallomurus sp. NPDC052274]|uniref:GntR family transcriptional regulator n=1 Tax=Actinoallomurus sp. NPDC052274 TaxID=3155420 RepID=UPI00343CE398
MSSGSAPWGAYAQIADALRGRIVTGKLVAGALLPSEAALCHEFSVARNTVRRALGLLEAEGLIQTFPGKGRMVAGYVTTPYTYLRIAAELRQQIDSGELVPGEVLPSEAALMAQYGVARGTARQALAHLEAAGLVEVRHGKGRFVRRRP